ncbi:amino acid adenylation domain-containing protein [Pseudoalteromonas tunicata]|uniref:non-ribosomal peptide synthetase n=1 Tax=Pseudoalteromonas tunicata TaxID=314281 RepID=UPI00273F4298|nr:non-ribosomal peptide synthetase [Pseudoalteromonas tunicata]MDP5213363.1 amino acid adenylation domain-containing protein [Pseudoalteromonas tunicata]
MSIATIIAEFENRGVYLWAEQERLKFKAPAGVMNNQLVQLLKDNKPALLEYLTDPVMTAIESNIQDRFKPFPLTDLQLAYLVGRTNAIEYGNVGCHSYIELDLPKLDANRLQAAWHKLVERHDMLRATINLDGMQKIQAEVIPKPIKVHDLSGCTEYQYTQSLSILRESLAHKHYQPEQWPQYDVHLSNLPNASVLHFSIDLLIADFASIQILLAELGELYNDPEQVLAPLKVSYRDIVLARKAMLSHPKTLARYEKHKAYWLEQIKTLPAPAELPLAKHNNKQAQVEFKRLNFELPETSWQLLKEKAQAHKLTPSSLVLAAFTEVISRWSRHPEFSLNLTMLNRANSHPDVRSIVGDFIAVNVLGVKPNPQFNFSERAKALQAQLWRDLEHSDFTGVEVLRALNQAQKSNTIVPIVYTSTLGLSGDDLDENEFMHQAKLRYGITQTPQVWLDCQATERNNMLIVDWDIRQGIFQSGTIEAAHQAFCQLLETLSSDNTLWQSSSPVKLSSKAIAQHQLLNDTKVEQVQGHLHSGFARHALAIPEKLAVIDGTQHYSYQQVAQRALAIKTSFLNDVTAGSYIGIISNKGINQIAAVLAVLLADCIYVPIEAELPASRQANILANAKVKRVLSEIEFTAYEKAEVANLNKFNLDENDSYRQVFKEFLVTPEQKQFIEKPAYVIYTSGTTGQPKGVEMSHGGALNTVLAINHKHDVSQHDKTLALVSYGFDLSIWDIFGTFSAGATLVLPKQHLRGDPNHWHQLITEEKISVWNSVPAQMQMLMESLAWSEQHDLSSLKLAMLSGDWIPVELAKTVLMKAPNLSLVSLGGPTETAIWCVDHPVKAVAQNDSFVPYGKPLPNHQIHILNNRFELCPIGVDGEMYIAGDGLAKGYLNSPQLTSERFVFHPQTKQRLYCSGDIGCLMENGLIAIKGREDGQIKINGHRIELGEIEAHLSSHPQVKEATVVNLRTDGQLAAALVLSEQCDDQQVFDELKHSIAERLPKYMQVEHFVTLEKLPLNNNSKVDRKRLKQKLSELINQSQHVFEAPLDNEVEQSLQKIWQTILSVESISRQDDFFHLGGTSLNAINLLSALLSAGFDADIDLIFAHPVFSDMANELALAHQKKQAWLASINLEEQANLATKGLATAKPVACEIKYVLLTGSTGYLGSYLLRQLLTNTQYHITCLMRCDSSENGLQRLQSAALQKGLTSDFNPKRISIIAGDLSSQHFGLTTLQYETLANRIDCVIHNASIINLMDPLSALYPTNVNGAKEIIQFASSLKIKPVHYISTIGVHHALPEQTLQPVVEATKVVDWKDVELTYEQSKIMAETLFSQARSQGLPVNILRPGTITWARDSQPFINDDAFLKFYRACLEIHAYPSSDLSVNIVPVDYVAECIRAIVKQATGQSNNYHLVSDTSTQVTQLYTWFNQLGCDIQPLSFDKWKQKLNNNFVKSFVELYFKQGMDSGGHHQYGTDNLKAVLTQEKLASFSVNQTYLAPLARKYNNAAE